MLKTVESVSRFSWNDDVLRPSALHREICFPVSGDRVGQFGTPRNFDAQGRLES